MVADLVCGEGAFTIAILLVQDDIPGDSALKSVVRYCRLPLSGSEPIVAFNELPETYYVSGQDGDKEKNPNPLTKSCSKAARLSHVAAYDAAVFLSGDYPGLKLSKKGSLVKSLSSLSTSIANGVFLISSTGKADSTFRKSQYHAFTFAFPRTNFDLCAPTKELITYRQLLEIRQCGLQRTGAMSLSKDLLSFDTFDTVEICTGMCLFSEPNLNICIENGTIRPKKLANQPISISEMDIILRLSTTIANMAALYIYGTDSRRHGSLRINIDIPCAQYYQNALESFENGDCAPSDVLDWIVAIRERRALLFRAFRKAIEYGLRQRGLPKDSGEISLSCGLKAADQVILRNVLAPQGPVDWIKEILDSVLGDRDEFWADAIGLQDENEREPCSWRQFSTLTYVYEVLKPVLRARTASDLNKNQTTQIDHASTSASKSAPPSPMSNSAKQKDYFDPRTASSSAIPRRILLLAVDDQDESRIYTKANRSLCQLNATSGRSPGPGPLSSVPMITRILTICPAPQIIIGTSNPTAGWRRPSLWRAPLRSVGTQGAELEFRTEENSIESYSDIMKKVYDADLVENLKSWLRK